MIVIRRGKKGVSCFAAPGLGRQEVGVKKLPRPWRREVSKLVYFARGIMAGPEPLVQAEGAMVVGSWCHSSQLRRR